MNVFTRVHSEMDYISGLTQVQIHQYNDAELLEFFNSNSVTYDLIGDHLFIIRGRSGDLAAGLGDWLVMSPDGEVEIKPGDYRRRAERTINRAKRASRDRRNVVHQTR